MKTFITKAIASMLIIGAAIAIFALGVKVGHQKAYRDEHHLAQTLLIDINQRRIEEDVRGFLINRFYYTGLLSSRGFAQGAFHDYGCSTSTAPKGKWFDVASNQELYEEYLNRANMRRQ